MKKKLDDIFDENNLKKEIRRVKRKTIIKTLLISFIVSMIIFISGNMINKYISERESRKDYANANIMTQLTIPNGYITETYHDLGLLGGTGYYQIARQIGPKSVILKEDRTQFGLLSRRTFMMVSSLRTYSSEKPRPNYWENGYRKIIYYHPDIEYKKYKNDLKILDDLPDGKLIEMGISFDKKYKVRDINMIIPEVNKSWIWLDLFSEESMNKFRNEVENYDAKATYINERETLGVSVRWEVYSPNKFKNSVEKLFENLKKSPRKIDNDIDKEYTLYENNKFQAPDMLGCIVYGTKDELKTLLDNPHIKASSIGVVTDIY